MKQLTINVKESYYPIFMEFASKNSDLEIVDIDDVEYYADGDSDEEILQGIQEAVQELNLILAEKATPLTWEEFYSGL